MKLPLTILFSLLIFSSFASAKPAGIVLYFKDKGTTYFLLADDIRKSKGWSAFGGVANKGETSQETAARETYEETRGYFKKQWLLDKIRNQKPYSKAGFTMYFVEVPFVPAQRVQNNPLPNKLSISMRERENYAWIPESEILKAFNAGEKHQIDPLYLPSPVRSDTFLSYWLHDMKKARDQKLGPWKKKR